MELGNAIFGHSRGNVKIERYGFHAHHFKRLYEALDITEMDELYDTSWDGEVNNDVFEMRPYWWNDCTCGLKVEDDSQWGGHTIDCMLRKPNFLHKPSGYEIRWYKYPFRDSYANRSITEQEFATIVDECISSIKIAEDGE